MKKDPVGTIRMFDRMRKWESRRNFTDLFRKSFLDLYIWSELGEFRGTMEDFGHDNCKDAYAAFCPLLQSSAQGTFPRIGEIHLASSWLTPEIAAHEAVHAVLYWFRRFKVDLVRNEEDFAGSVGFVTQQIIESYEKETDSSSIGALQGSLHGNAVPLGGNRVLSQLRGSLN